MDGRILAGGQSLMPAMALRIARPPHLVDIKRVAGLDALEVVDGVLRVGAPRGLSASCRTRAARRLAGAGCAPHRALAHRLEEVSRRTGDFAQAAALVVLQGDAAGRLAKARIGVGGVEAVPRRIAVAEAASAAADPMEDDVYRRALTRTVVHRALMQAVA